jgi:hypothetical protein
MNPNDSFVTTTVGPESGLGTRQTQIGRMMTASCFPAIFYFFDENKMKKSWLLFSVSLFHANVGYFRIGFGKSKLRLRLVEVEGFDVVQNT